MTVQLPPSQASMTNRFQGSSPSKASPSAPKFGCGTGVCEGIALVGAAGCVGIPALLYGAYRLVKALIHRIPNPLKRNKSDDQAQAS